MQKALGPLMIDLQGLELSQEEQELLQHPHVGGVILFTRNQENRRQLKKLITAIRQARPGILIAVDQEGGRVQRFKHGFSLLPAPGSLESVFKKDPQVAKAKAEKLGYTMAQELLEVGIDFSFAPVLDVNRGRNQVIGDRSFGADIDTIYELGSVYIKGMHRAGMVTVGKHFPGHGSVEEDSHFDLPVDPRSYENILATDMQSFIKLLPQLDAIMPAHILFPEVDKNPAGFSHIWLQEILRKQLGFTGAIISDDMSMAAALDVGLGVERSLKALHAGCDMVIYCNNRPQVIEVLTHLNYLMSPTSHERLTRLRTFKNEIT